MGRKIKPIQLPENPTEKQRIHHRLIEPLRAALMEYGITRKELAEELGVHLTTVRDWFNSHGAGKNPRFPQLGEFVRISEAINQIRVRKGERVDIKSRPYFTVLEPGEKTEYERELEGQLRKAKIRIKELEEMKKTEIIKVERRVRGE